MEILLRRNNVAEVEYTNKRAVISKIICTECNKVIYDAKNDRVLPEHPYCPDCRRKKMTIEEE